MPLSVMPHNSNVGYLRNQLLMLPRRKIIAMKRIMLVIATSLSIVGCANQNSIYRTFDISKGESPMVDIRQRAVLVSPNKTTTEKFNKDGKLIEKTSLEKGMFVCAEPSPDAMASLAYELAAKGVVSEKASGELAFSMHDSAAFTGLRTQSIQLLRDFGYRLCESHMSGAITDMQYDLLMRRFQKNIVALLAIEQLTGSIRTPFVALTSGGKAEATRSLSEMRFEREKVGDKITSLGAEKTDLEKTKKKALDKDPKADITEIDKEIKDIDDKSNRLKDDLKVIDEAIANNKGVIAEGKTEVTIKTDVTSVQRSDEHIQKVADVVHDIVNNIVLSDDGKQICMSVLQKDQISEYAKWCFKMLNSLVAAEEAYTNELQKNISTLRDNLSKAEPDDAFEIQDKLDKQMTELKRQKKGLTTFTIMMPDK